MQDPKTVNPKNIDHKSRASDEQADALAAVVLITLVVSVVVYWLETMT